MFDLISSNGMIQSMSSAMTLATRRMGLVASNLANIDTPGYRTQDFSFEGALKQAFARQDGAQGALWRTQPGHLAPTSSSSLTPARDEARPAYERNDGNDVNLDQQTLLLSRTQGQYSLAASFMQVELRRIYQALREGSK